MRWWCREVNVPNLCSTEQSTVALIGIIMWDAVLIWLNGGVSSKADCVVAVPIWHIYFLTIPPPKGNISALNYWLWLHTYDLAL